MARVNLLPINEVGSHVGIILRQTIMRCRRTFIVLRSGESERPLLLLEASHITNLGNTAIRVDVTSTCSYYSVYALVRRLGS